MNTKSMIVIGLIAMGVVVLASLGLGLITPGKSTEFLGVNIVKDDGQFIPPIAGALALVCGIVVLLVKPRRV
jgi:hypothetical protein